MNVLSLFDGMSCGMIALERCGISVNKYYASEIDKYATKVSEANYPNIIRMGDVTNWRDWDIDWSSIDLVMGGFPCQAWSMAGKQLGDKDERGKLLWTMLDIIKQVRHHNPDAHFLIENVKMKKSFEEYITYHTENALGKTYKILINSALVSAQNRNRYYWTSWECDQPKDRDIKITSILDFDFTQPNSQGWQTWWKNNCEFQLKKQYSAICNNNSTDKAITMTARQFSSWNGNFFLLPCGKLRNLTPIECERLQTLLDNYTNYVSNTQRYKMLGNGWTVDVIVHLLTCLINQTNNH